MQSDDELQRQLGVRQGTKGMPGRVSQDAQTYVTGEAPESILQAIKEDLAARINIAVSYRASERGYFFLCEMPIFLHRTEGAQ